jgi:predicted NBD/HSP70 family sugar kinase
MNIFLVLTTKIIYLRSNRTLPKGLFLRGSTQIQILKLLRVHITLSRADLAEKLGMNRGNITRSVATMLEKKWLIEHQKEDDKKTSRRGQPPIYLTINPQAFSAIGIAISTSIYISMVDGCGEVTKTIQIPNTLVDNALEAINQICIEVKKLLKSSKGKNLGIGLTTTGTFTENKDLLYSSYYTGGPGTRKLLIKNLEYLNNGPVFSELIANVYPLAEYQAHPELRDNKTFLCVSERLGLGGLWEGKLISGSRHKKLSLQHVKVPGDEARCHCTERGCLRMSASMWSIHDRLNGAEAGSRGRQKNEQYIRENSELHERLRRREPLAIELMQQAAEAIYDATEPFVIAFQPDVLFFDEWLGVVPEFGIDFIHNKYKNYSLRAQFRAWQDMKIISYSHFQGAVGSAILVIENNYGATTPHMRIQDFTETLDR